MNAPFCKCYNERPDTLLRREIYIQDQRRAIQLAEQRAHEEGHKEGRELERTGTVIQAYLSGMASKKIAQMFNLELGEIERIINKKD